MLPSLPVRIASLRVEDDGRARYFLESRGVGFVKKEEGTDLSTPALLEDLLRFLQQGGSGELVGDAP